MLLFPLLICSRSWAALGLLSLFVLVFSRPSQAQVYPGSGGGAYTGPIYTGGTVTTTSSNFDYSPYSDGAYGGQYYASGGTDANGNAVPSTVTCSGGINSTFTWYNDGDPNNKPPKCVIITEYCIAQWHGSASGGASVNGGCTNPLGSASVPDVPGYGATWEWTRYTVQNDPPATLVVKCSPEAHVTASGSYSPYASSNGTASVKYSVSVSPVTVGLEGVTVDPSDKSLHALTGQQVTALLYSPFPASNFNWSFTGASGYNPFETCHCAATLTPPSGPTLTVNVASKPITYHKPAVSWTVGQPFIDPNGHLLKPGFFGDQPNGAFSANELWGPMKVTEPALFTATNSPGLGAILQIATLSRSNTRVPLNGLPSTYTKLGIMYTNGSGGAVASPTGLDVSFPYAYGYFQNPDGTLSYSDGAWLASNNGFSGDGPYQSYVNHDQDGGGNAWNASTASDSFNTWVMYEPSIKDDQGVIYVPLQTLTWSWGGNASLNHLGFWDVNGNPPFSPGNPGTTDTYPSWDLLTLAAPFNIGP